MTTLLLAFAGLSLSSMALFLRRAAKTKKVLTTYAHKLEELEVELQLVNKLKADLIRQQGMVVDYMQKTQALAQSLQSVAQSVTSEAEPEHELSKKIWIN